MLPCRYVRGGLVESILLQLVCCMLMEPLVAAIPGTWLVSLLPPLLYRKF